MIYYNCGKMKYEIRYFAHLSVSDDTSVEDIENIKV